MTAVTTTLVSDIAHPFERVRTWHVTDDEFCIRNPSDASETDAMRGAAMGKVASSNISMSLDGSSRTDFECG